MSSEELRTQTLTFYRTAIRGARRAHKHAYRVYSVYRSERTWRRYEEANMALSILQALYKQARKGSR